MSTKYLQDENGNYYTDENGNLLTVDVSGEGGSTTSLFGEWTTGTSGNLYLPSAGLYEIKVVVLEYDEPRTMTFFVDWDASSYSYSQATLYEISSNDSTSIISVDDTGLLEYYNTDYTFDTDNIQSISYRKVNEQISAGGSSNSGGGDSSSSNNGMPTIRLVTVRDADGTMSITENNPLTFTVEITSGSLQVGDQLQICNKELYTYKGKTQKRYKLRRFAEYVVTEDDLNKKHLYLSVGNGRNPSNEIDRLCRGGRGNDRYPKYIRLRRGIPHQETGEPWSASFSNAIQIRVYGFSRGGSMDGASLTIR